MTSDRIRILRKWVAGLRSGFWQQAKGCLKDSQSGACCCLGVLTELAVGEGVLPPATVEASSDPVRFTYQDVSFSGLPSRQTTVLPKAVAAWAGIKNPCGPYLTIGGQRFLATEHNDTTGASFERIADALEVEIIQPLERGETLDSMIGVAE